jgi:RND family efflux transporter MFP subunit
MMQTKSSLFLTLSSFLCLLIFTGCNEPQEKPAARSLPQVEVEVETLSLSEAPIQVELAGSLQAVEQVTISARVAGQIVKLPVQLGSKVKKGDLLVKIAAAEINARVQQAETQLAQARRNLARETALHEVDASTRTKVKTLAERVQIKEAEYLEAKTILGYTQITAPFAGTVTDKSVDVGDQAAPGVPLLQLENDSKLEVVIQVPEGLSKSLTLGSRLPLTVPAAGLTLNAQIREIAPTVDPASRTTQIKLLLPAASGLRSGQFARVALPGNQAKSLLVRSSALRKTGQLHQVFVAEQGLARMRLVRIGAEIDGRTEILSGLQEGDQVVVDALGKLQDGQPLKVLTDGSAQ